MLKLFRIEWLKIKTYKTFWFLFLTFVVMYPLIFYFMADKYMDKQVSMQEKIIKNVVGAPFVFPKIWHASGWFGGLFFVMIGMLFILLITNEVQYRTHRQNIIDGWSRFDFLKAKLTILIFFVLTSTAIVFLTGLIVGYIYSPSHVNNIFKGVYYIWYFALMATLYLMAAFIIAILTKRTGLAIIFYFAFVCIIDNLLWALLTMHDSQIGYFLPLESSDSLVPNPFKLKAMEKRTVPDYVLIMTVCGYISLFAFIITRYFRKTDLKT